MKVLSHVVFASCTALCPVFAPFAFAAADVVISDTMPAVVVKAEAMYLAIPNAIEKEGEALRSQPFADGGAFLRDVPGVTAGRMGGHGLEPVIHGLQQTQLTIRNNGAMQHGGCPNRMDTPTSYVTAGNYDSVKIIKGYQTVTEGAGAPGGQVIFDRVPPQLAQDKPYRGQVGGGYESNSQAYDGFFDVAAGRPDASIRALGNWKKAGNYTDGSHKEVRTAYEQYGKALEIAGRPTDRLQLGAGFENTRTQDALFAGASMDAPDSESNVYRVNGSYEPTGGLLANLSADGYTNTVDHLMDNYSLRSRTSGFMKAVTESDSFGGKVKGKLQDGTTLGLDFAANKKQGDRYSGMSSGAVTTLQSVLWPDVNTNQTGLFAEKTFDLPAQYALTIGGRYDYLSSKAGRANVQASGGVSPNTLYNLYYGTTAHMQDEHALGGLIRLEKQLDAARSVYGSLSRTVRPADATERFIAANASTMPGRWVGNPNIRSEKHHQAEMGVVTTYADWGWNTALSANQVDDYILRDTARGQAGILQQDGATIYRNVGARLLNVEFGANRRLTDTWRVEGHATYTHGDNTDENKPLAQIPPLNGQVDLIYSKKTWENRLRTRAAMTQTRVDDNVATGSGRDPGKTSGYVVFDLLSRVDLTKSVSLNFGVTNVLNHTYANHLNRASSFDPTELQVNEPGRAVFVRFTGRF